MAKKTAKKSTKRSSKLTPMGSQVLIYLVNNLAIGDFDRCCGIEDIAKYLGRSDARVKKLIDQLQEAGFVETTGETYGTVFPTAAAIQRQDSSVSAAGQGAIKTG